MKRKVYVICMIAAMLFVLSGCSKVSSDSLINDSIEQEETEESQEDVVDREEPPEIVESAILTQKKVLEENDVLFYIPNETIESTIQQQIFLYDGALLTCCSKLSENGIDLCLKKLSLETGESICETVITEIAMYDIQLCGDKVAVKNWESGQIWMLDANLEVTANYQLDNKSECSYLNLAGDTAYCFYADAGICEVDLQTMQQKFLLENVGSLYMSDFNAPFLSFSYVDLNTQKTVYGVLNVETGEIEQSPYTGAYFGIMRSADIWIAGLPEQDNSYVLVKNNKYSICQLEEPGSMIVLLENPQRMMVTSYDDAGQRIRLYHMDGSFLSECRISQTYTFFSNELYWSEADGGYFFTVIDETGHDQLLFWDMSVPKNGKPLSFSPMETQELQPGTAVAQEYYDRAKALSDAYGVTIKIADQCDTEFQTYRACRETEPAYIAKGLDALEQALSVYPENFIEQLYYDSYEEIEINLMGEIINWEEPENITEAGFDTFSAFVEHDMGKTVMVVNINSYGELEQTIHHEIMHIIDEKLIFDAKYREDALYSEETWCSFNPEGFAYADSVYEVPESMWSDGYDSFFIDLYSRTYAKEDRARIMEYAMMNYDWAFSGSPGRKAKLEYLCQCIRACFDTTGWPEITTWERVLQ